MSNKLHPIRWVLKVFFRLLYHELAWTYDVVAYIVSAGLWGTWIQEAIPHIVGPRVLELGHGPGHLQIKMIESGLQAFGLDQSKQMSALAMRNIQKSTPKRGSTYYGYAHSSRLARGIAQELPFPSASFESILATFPTEYILDPATLQEIHRILIPGGRLVILFGAWITGIRWNEKAAAWLFQVTGQIPERNSSWVDPIENVGFHTSVITQDLPSSQLIFLIGEKPRPN